MHASMHPQRKHPKKTTKLQSSIEYACMYVDEEICVVTGGLEPVKHPLTQNDYEVLLQSQVVSENARPLLSSINFALFKL